MNTYAIKDFELGVSLTVKAQGVAEAMYDYLPWPTLDATITYRANEGWVVIDNKTDFKYEVSSI